MRNNDRKNAENALNGFLMNNSWDFLHAPSPFFISGSATADVYKTDQSDTCLYTAVQNSCWTVSLLRYILMLVNWTHYHDGELDTFLCWWARHILMLVSWAHSHAITIVCWTRYEVLYSHSSPVTHHWLFQTIVLGRSSDRFAVTLSRAFHERHYKWSRIASTNCSERRLRKIRNIQKPGET